MFSNLTGAETVYFIISILLAMSVHEAMHAFTSHWLGDTTAQEQGRLTLNPLKHINLYTTILLPIVMVISGLPPIMAAQPVPFNPNRVKYDEFGVALVGVAGPLTNLSMASIAAFVFRFMPGLGASVYDFLAIFTLVNVGLFVFNMIPFPPLDGSRVLYAFAPEPLQKLMRSIEQMGFMAILFFFFLVFQFMGNSIIVLDEKLFRLLMGA